MLLSRNEAYSVRELVTVAPLTARIRHIPVEVPVGPEDGLPKPCVINLDTVVTIAKSHLKTRVTSLSADKIRQAERALRFALALED